MKSKNLFKTTVILICTAFYMTSCREAAPENEVVTATQAAVDRIDPEAAYPGESGVIRKGTLFGKEISYTEIDGKAVFEGDIILTPEQLKTPTNARTEGAVDTYHLWTNNTVYYKIDASITDRTAIYEAIAEFENNTSLKFVGENTRGGTLPVYPILRANVVKFTRARGYSSSVGMIGGEQFIGLPFGATKGGVLHEIGHTVGMLHEHTRADRDGSVKVNLNNVSDDDKSSFTKISEGAYDPLQYGKFDFNSVMMMDSYAYSKNGMPVMTKMDGSTFAVQRSYLSANDINSITAAYANVFAAKADNIYVGDAAKGKITKFAGYFPATEKMFAVSGRLFATRDIGIWKLHATAGQGYGVGAGYPTKGITYLNDYVYALQNGYIRKIGVHNPGDYNIGYQYWLPATAITYAYGFFFIVNADQLFRVGTGGTTLVSMGSGYKGVTEMVTLKDKIYLLKNGGKLYKIDPMTGGANLHGQATFEPGAQLASNGKNLLITSGNTLFSVDENGAVKTISYGWAGTTELAAFDPANK